MDAKHENEGSSVIESKKEMDTWETYSQAVTLLTDEYEKTKDDVKQVVKALHEVEVRLMEKANKSDQKIDD